MQTKICKVIAQTDPVYVQSKKTESGQMPKCTIRLRELGGNYDDEYQRDVLGELALKKFTPGQIVAANLWFRVHESNGTFYQDVLAYEIVPIN